MQAALAAIINDGFPVHSGSKRGSCDTRTKILTSWFAEAQALVASGLQVFQDVSDGTSPYQWIAQYYRSAYMRRSPTDMENEEYKFLYGKDTMLI